MLGRDSVPSDAADTPRIGSRSDEQFLDWQENQRRDAGDVKRVDRAFFGWLILGIIFLAAIVLWWS